MLSGLILPIKSIKYNLIIYYNDNYVYTLLTKLNLFPSELSILISYVLQT